MKLETTYGVDDCAFVFLQVTITVDKKETKFILHNEHIS